MDKIGLIAGGGDLPVILAEEARKKGVKVIGFAIKGMTSSALDKACARTHWFDPTQITKFKLLMLVENIKKVVMLGKVDKSIIYTKPKNGEKDLNLLKNSGDKSDYAMLDRITEEFTKRGIEVISGIEYLSDLFPPKGALTNRHPSERELVDISFGLEKAREIARMDIGQTIVVKDKTVISVEAMEGTDNAIKRGASLCGEGFVVIKVSRPQQDMRWDVPAVGAGTIDLIARNKGKALAIEEKKTFLVHPDICVRLADNNDMSIVIV
ncbi:MAG: UDP-2,3-diacylglucosamine diphosphatase LpxI [Candidatus Omnitrophica bacterium]|nr:UDP-2,3-diacylglucosamine diphosphatase LpxI [Candidatus Omnitrophota bacterium]